MNHISAFGDPVIDVAELRLGTQSRNGAISNANTSQGGKRELEGVHLTVVVMKLHLVFLSGSLLILGTVSACAQVNVAVGVGTATAPSSNQSIDTFGTGTPFNTPSLNGAFGKISGGANIKPWLGVGAEYSFRFAQAPYAGLNYRPSFYDVNAVFTPSVHSKRIQPEFQAGLGAMNLRYYENQSACDNFAGCSSSNTFVESSNHFQLHGLAGVRFYVTEHVFVRPEVEVHWVKNLFQFGSNVVPQYGVSLGYSFGL